jgi:hypothetical protein
MRCLGLACRATLLIIAPASAATLEVGAGKPYATPSAASAAAHDGDHVLIGPGTYYDCAVWHASDLLIEGAGAEATVITDTTCGGKALFVTEGDRITIRALTLARARVPDDNGAGIRADGTDLTVQDTRFVNDQVGILDAATSGSLRVVACAFIANGDSFDGSDNVAVRAGSLGLLRIERSEFQGARGGGHVASDARRTDLVGNRFFDDGGRMTGPLISVADGGLLLEGNTITLAAGAADRPGAVLVIGHGAGIAVRGNTLREAAGGTVPLLRNWSDQAAVAEDNAVPQGVAAVSEEGSTYRRLRARAATWRDLLRRVAGQARHGLAALLHGLI